MSNIIEYRYDLTTAAMSVNGVGRLDGTTTFISPLQLPSRGNVKMQVCAITMSDRIPNIMNANPFYDWNNTLVRVYTNQAGTTRDIALPRGLYITPDIIGDAINAAITADLTANWWTDPTDPGLIIEANQVTDQVNISINSTKLKAPHTIFNIDFRKSTTGTDLATTLGFSQGTALMTGVAGTTVLYTSNQEVRMDQQGTVVDVRSGLISNRRRNGEYVRTLAIIPFAGKLTASENVWPPAGQISPELVYEGSRTITGIQVEVKTSTGLPMLFMSGGIHIIIAFLY